MADGQFGGGPVPPTNPEPLSLLQMAQAAMGGGDDPYGGRTLAQTVIGGLPYNMNADVNGRAMDGGAGGFDVGAGGGFDYNAWLDRPATNENVSDAIQRGGQYRPEFAKTLQSSGAEGGFFSIPGEGGGERSIPWGYYPNPNDPGAASGDPTARNPAPGLLGLSTNNWRLLPQQFRNPKYAMRAGHIIDRFYADKPGAYLTSHGGIPPQEQNPQTTPLGGGGHGFPLGYGSGPTGLHFFPGQLEPALSDRWGG